MDNNKKSEVLGIAKTEERSKWERPVLRRLDAADAEMMDGAGSDGMSGINMMGS